MSKNLIQQAVEILRQGGLVGLPTETVYGLAADAKNPLAVSKVFAAKGRPADHPLIVHIGTINELSEWAKAIVPQAYQLAERFWPGPLTLILKKQDHVLDEVTGGQDTVAVRIPDHPLALELLQAFGSGLVAPSANQFGRISPTDEAAVLAELGKKVDLILPGGRTRVGIESTIVDLSQQPFTLLRRGMVRLETLEACLGEKISLPDVHTKIRAPGLLASHYAPRSPLKLFEPAELIAILQTIPKQRVIILAQTRPVIEPDACSKWRQMPDTPEEYAHELYAMMRLADAEKPDLILVESPPHTAEWAAIHDRLKRAAANL